MQHWLYQVDNQVRLPNVLDTNSLFLEVSKRDSTKPKI